MTMDEVVAIAEKVGLTGLSLIDVGYLGSFAELVSASEREACAQTCEARYMGDNTREDIEARRCAEAIRTRGQQ